MNDLKAGRELDALVAEKVMGWTDIAAEHRGLGSHWYVPSGIDPFSRPNPGMRQQLPEYSTDIAAAWLVVEKMAPVWMCDMRVTWDGFGVDFDNLSQTFAARVDPRDGGMPLAICLAAIKAVESLSPSGSADQTK